MVKSTSRYQMKLDVMYSQFPVTEEMYIVHHICNVMYTNSFIYLHFDMIKRFYIPDKLSSGL